MLALACSSDDDRAGATGGQASVIEVAPEPESPCPPETRLEEEQRGGGPRVRICRRLDGTFHGLYQVEWTGVVTAEGAYRDGLESGRWVFRHHSGKTWKEGEYHDGLMHGTWKVYGPGGEALGAFEMDRGTGTEIRWWDNGHKRQSIEMRSGRAHGVTTWWQETGERIMEAHYEDGKAHGAWTFWDALGRTRKVEEWTGGILGNTTWFDPSAEQEETDD
jgi:antitoxin component YwqK of YwqJK toxin-antitoxin module